MFTDVPLAKARHMAHPRVNVGGDADAVTVLRCGSLGASNPTVYHRDQDQDMG